jgi:hypothetical protein
LKVISSGEPLPFHDLSYPPPSGKAIASGGRSSRAQLLTRSEIAAERRIEDEDKNHWATGC